MITRLSFFGFRPAPHAKARHASKIAAKRDRVLLVASIFPPVLGGSAVVYENLARHAAGRITVLAPTVNYVDGSELAGWQAFDAAAPYRIERCPLLRTRLPKDEVRGMARGRLLLSELALRLVISARLLRLIVTERTKTVCIGDALSGGWMLALLRWVPFIRTIVYVHGEELTTISSWDPQRRRTRRTLRLADGVIVVSRFTEAVAHELLGPAEGNAKLALIPNGVDGQRFRPLPRRAELVERYGLSGRFVYVSVGRLVERKGLDNVIRAMPQLLSSVPDAMLLAVGAGPFEPELRRLAELNGVADRVVFAGAVPDATLADHYRLGDVFVMPNRRLPDGDTEGFGLVFLEANACGLPVIAGRDGGSTDAVQHGDNGLVVDGASVAEVAAAMRLLRKDATLRDKLRRGGLRVAAASGWSKRTDMFLKRCTVR
ncbi:glycosyltransferase family 4 protein [Reyranella sp.]|uniref:glycosyltransferase family 4 protein n=1 Tax=Reyranella sp. TaxID=1929291 RepID=UPI003D0DE58C